MVGLVVLFDVSREWLCRISNQDVDFDETSILDYFTAVLRYIEFYFSITNNPSISTLTFGGSGPAQLVFSSRDVVREASTSTLYCSGQLEILKSLELAFSKRVGQILREGDGEESTLLSALVCALCYVNKVRRGDHSSHTRIMVVQGSPDDQAQFMKLAALCYRSGSLNFSIDSCSIGRSPSAALQHISAISGGHYHHVSDISLLLASLVNLFCMDSTKEVRPRDMRAVCYCHGIRVARAFVCSVCLAVFCHYVPLCLVCRSHFGVLPLCKWSCAAK